MLSTALHPPRPTIHPPLASPRRSARRAQHGAPPSSSNHPSAAGIASPLMAHAYCQRVTKPLSAGRSVVLSASC
jgi:hypothetical protein